MLSIIIFHYKKKCDIVMYSTTTDWFLRPCTIHFNEVLHSEISVEEMISLNANEALVVYTQDSETKNVTRNVQYGPSLFMLNENEW